MKREALPLPLLLLLLILGMTPAAAQGSERFDLAQIADRFPSQGYEHQIEFWKQIFGKFSTREVVIHDLDDLRLTYHLEVFDRGIEGDPKEARRQRELLLKRIEAVGELIRSLKFKDPENLNAEQRAIHQTLSRNGYPLQPDVLDRLSRNLRYQRGVRDKFRDGMVRSGMYLPWIEEVFAEYRLPLELAYLPHVESSFDYNAYSKAGAAGIWQFTRGTGRSYMQITNQIDERLDPIRATEAAAKLLSENYRDLGNWPLAVTAYNHGKNGMMRAKKEHGPDLRDIIRNYRSKAFGFASRNFYAEFLAALVVARNHYDYFGAIEPAPPLEFDTIDLVRATPTNNLVQVPGVTQADLLHLNPHLRRFVAAGGNRIPAGIEVRVPRGRGPAVAAALKGAGTSADTDRVQAAPGTRHTVRPGESLAKIANHYGTTVAQLQRLNDLKNPNLVHPGQRLLIRPEEKPAAAVAVAAPASAPPAQSTGPSKERATGRYTVQPGDTLGAIARKFNTSVDALLRLNQLTNPNLVRAGMVLRIGESAETVNGSGEVRYTVRRGDTLANIAQRFGTSVRAITAANRIANPHQIKLGQELVIPAAD